MEESKLIRCYFRCSKTPYATDEDISTQQVVFGMYDSKDGTIGEMTMEWRQLGSQLAPKLGIYDDAWGVLATFDDLIKELAKWDNKNMTEEQFIQLLDSLGFIDGTIYKE